VERTALYEDVEQRIVKMRTVDTTVQRLDVQVREVPAVEVPDEVGRAQVDDFPVLDHAGRFCLEMTVIHRRDMRKRAMVRA
jgi:hypothetical protein